MKKVLAVVFVLAILCSCFTIAAHADSATPTITIHRNKEDSVAKDQSASLSLKATNFGSVKGMNLIITAPESVTFTGLSGSFIGSSTVALSQNNNYTLSAHEIKIVSAFVINPADSLDATITLQGTAIGAYELTVTTQLVNAQVAYFTTGTYNIDADRFVVNKTGLQPIAEGSETLANPNDGTFIPYGALYSQTGGNYAFPDKNEDGSFTLDSEKSYSYTAFRIPTNAGLISTFSASQKVGNAASNVEYEKTNGVQFGSYTPNASLGAHGTFVFKGDFSAFCAAKGITEDSALNTFASHLNANPNKWYQLSYGNNKTLMVARVPQTRVMWEGSGALQYALRIYNVSSEERFVAIGYTLIDNNYYFSDEYLTKAYT